MGCALADGANSRFARLASEGGSFCFLPFSLDLTWASVRQSSGAFFFFDIRLSHAPRLPPLHFPVAQRLDRRIVRGQSALSRASAACSTAVIASHAQESQGKVDRVGAAPAEVRDGLLALQDGAGGALLGDAEGAR